MNRKSNIVYNVIILACTVGLAITVVALANNTFYADLFTTLLLFLLGAILAGILNTVLHEWGHVLAGKRAGMEFLSLRLWFFTIVKENGKTRWIKSRFIDQAGACEMIPAKTDDLKKSYRKMTAGGLAGSAVAVALGIVFAALVGILPSWLYCLLSVFLPVSVYCFLTNALPMSDQGIRNDGGVLYGIAKDDDTTAVALSLLQIQAELYAGKSPAEISPSLYFELPQLPEDDANFLLLLSARYAYYLDAGDAENANKVSERIFSVKKYVPKVFLDQVNADLLYNASAVNKSEYEADDLMDYAEKYLNGEETASNMRIKAAYVLYVVGDREKADRLIARGEELCDAERIPGIAKMERKLLAAMKEATPETETPSPAEEG